MLPKLNLVRIAMEYARANIQLYELCNSRTLPSNYMDTLNTFRSTFTKCWKLKLVSATPKAHQLISPRDAFKKKNVIFSDIVIKCVSGSG